MIQGVVQCKLPVATEILPRWIEILQKKNYQNCKIHVVHIVMNTCTCVRFVTSCGGTGSVSCIIGSNVFTS